MIFSVVISSLPVSRLTFESHARREKDVALIVKGFEPLRSQGVFRFALICFAGLIPGVKITELIL